MVADIIYICGSVIAILALLDLLMSDKQKAWLALKVMALWEFLDRLSSFDFIYWLLPKAIAQFYFRALLFFGFAFVSSLLTGNPYVFIWFGIVSLAWLIPVLITVVAAVVSLVVRIVELIVRRIAEYPKGPILAVSVFLGSVATILKAV